MGMDSYKSSLATHAVWDSADAHLISAYGFSIFVRENPKKKTIHFGGIKGQAIRERYMEMSYDTTDKDGNTKSLPLFADINIRSLQHTFTYPKGLLFAAQFAQIALVVMSRAAFAGHSLGEFPILAVLARRSTPWLFGLVKVKEMLKDIVNGCYDTYLKSKG
jgi:fatty acid synthase subunit beta